MQLGSFCIREAAAETEDASHVRFGYSICTAPTVEQITDIFKREGWGWKAEVEQDCVLLFFFLFFFISGKIF